jgi:methylthioribose-1-phosphate isomerase
LKVDGVHYRSIWFDEAAERPRIIDQTELPHRFEERVLEDVGSAAEAIRTMRVRGAPLIGATAAYGLALAVAADPKTASLDAAAQQLAETRPTAVNLRWAIERVVNVVRGAEEPERAAIALDLAKQICDDDVASCEAIGDYGLALLRERFPEKRSKPLQILTHCNAGWLATVDWGTALSPIYKAQEVGLPIHVWVDETRPRNQGASLTAFELRQAGIPHTVIVDNAGGHLMQRGEVDAVIVGSDRTTSTGDVCNKIGTYLKALAAHDNDVPFFVALPLSTVDWEISDGLREIPIEERSSSEVREMSGLTTSGDVEIISLFPEESPVANPAFDVTPARYVTALITDEGTCTPDRAGLAALRKSSAAG